MQFSVARQNSWHDVFVRPDEVQRFSDQLSIKNASLRVIRYTIHIFGSLKGLPEIWWKIANATNLVALLRIPVSFYFLVDELRLTLTKSQAERVTHGCKAIGKIGALSAQCLQLYKCLRKASVASSLVISERALIVFGSLGFVFAMIGITGHAKAALQSYTWLKNGYQPDSTRCKMVSHLLAISSIILNSIAIVLIQAVGLVVAPYLIFGTSAVISLVRYEILKPRIH